MDPIVQLVLWPLAAFFVVTAYFCIARLFHDPYEDAACDASNMLSGDPAGGR